MNFKRFISGVSAFAVASSVLAGLAVTASADYSTDENGIKTWDFTDYSAENSNYDVFKSYEGTDANNASIGTSGITYSRETPDTATMATHGYVTFTAPAKGILTVTFKVTEGSTGRYGDGFIYADADGASTLASTGTMITGDTKDLTINVSQDTAYYLFARRHAAKYACAMSIISVTFKPAARPVPKYTEPTELEFDNEALFVANGNAAISSSEISFDRNEKNDSSIANGNYVTFTAPQNGKIEVTFAGDNSDGRYWCGFVYGDVNGTSVLAKLDSANPANSTSTTEAISVTKGATYYLYGRSYNSYACSAKITKVLFTPEVEDPAITASLTKVESESYSTEAGYDQDVTAAKLYVTVENGSAKVKVTYNEQEQTTATSLEGTAVIGAILTGGAGTVGTEDFQVTAVVE